MTKLPEPLSHAYLITGGSRDSRGAYAQKLAAAYLCEGERAPCGACRQSILEYETLGKQPVKIYLYGDDGIYVVDRVADLLPLHFDSF